ncbi:MAG: hypothetical protein ACUBOA_13890 [Candidatus Loosdrechtia sp.]|uniref:hypothetical protein n=1 Tax=Candidatus Loosdrechtia sp. TaxID=3101272 RepID=UPI003A757E16|nr:MAG: hypothetical protein QY305_05820 [Candidatus Jettenia sp. AMX2]
MPPLSVKQLEGEIPITELRVKNTVVTLTNKRVYQELLGTEKTEVKFIPLNRIDSLGLVTTQKLWLFIAGIIACLFGAGIDLVWFSRIGNEALFFTAPGIVMILAWLFTRRTGGVIYSTSGRMEIFIEVLDPNTITEFLDQVQVIMDTEKGG